MTCAGHRGELKNTDHALSQMHDFRCPCSIKTVKRASHALRCGVLCPSEREWRCGGGVRTRVRPFSNQRGMHPFQGPGEALERAYLTQRCGVCLQPSEHGMSGGMASVCAGG